MIAVDRQLSRTSGPIGAVAGQAWSRDAGGRAAEDFRVQEEVPALAEAVSRPVPVYQGTEMRWGGGAHEWVREKELHE